MRVTRASIDEKIDALNAHAASARHELLQRVLIAGAVAAVAFLVAALRRGSRV